MLPFCSPKLDERSLRVLDTLNVKLHPLLRNGLLSFLVLEIGADRILAIFLRGPATARGTAKGETH